ncbi:MAG: hypothetical protein AAGA56_08340 [Myxococcota bacterium]
MFESVTAAPSTRRLGLWVSVLACLATTTGCASRAAPFNDLDQASVQIMRVKEQPAGGAPQVPAGVPVPPGFEQFAGLAQQTLEQLKATGMIPPGLNIPGLAGPAPTNPQLPPYTHEPHWGVEDSRPISDSALRDELLDIFGDGGSFNGNRQNCFNPSFAVSFASPTAAPVDVVVSFQCNQAVGYGFQWPHPESGLTPETSQKLAQIHQQVFGVPPT